MINESVKTLVYTSAFRLVQEHGPKEAGRRLGGITDVSAVRLAAFTPVRQGTFLIAATALGVLPMVSAPEALAVSSLPDAR